MWIDVFVYFGLILLLPFLAWRFFLTRLARRGLLIKQHRLQRDANEQGVHEAKEL
jgi:hypothetical protein